MMMIVLHIDSSPRGADSVSRVLTGQIIDRLKAPEPNFETVRRDLGSEPLPHLSSDAIDALRRAELTTDEQRQVAARSDRIVEELQRADLIVIGSPMYNFGITSQLKAWFDTVIRAGKTFRYTDAGPEGLLKGKPAIVVESRGGVYSVGPRAEFNHQEPHLKTLLGFIGIDDVQFIHAEGLDMGPESRANGLAHAQGAVEQALSGRYEMAA
jgi:FMN-dependent NADH-azoreductase